MADTRKKHVRIAAWHGETCVVLIPRLSECELNCFKRFFFSRKEIFVGENRIRTTTTTTTKVIRRRCQSSFSFFCGKSEFRMRVQLIAIWHEIGGSCRPQNCFKKTPEDETFYVLRNGDAQIMDWFSFTFEIGSAPSNNHRLAEGTKCEKKLFLLFYFYFFGCCVSSSFYPLPPSFMRSV